MDHWRLRGEQGRRPVIEPLSLGGYSCPVRPTQADVAAKAGVSRALVSMVFRDEPNVSAESRERILRVAADLGYRPNLVARSLASKRMRTVGILLNDITNPFFARIYVEIRSAAQELGYDVLVAPGVRSVAGERALLNTLLDHQVSGLILISPLTGGRQLAEVVGNIPTVLLFRQLSLPSADVVTNNELVGARIVLRHLTGFGHSRIAHISGGRSTSGAQRRRAYERVMREMGLGAHIHVIEGDFTEQAGKNAATELIASGPMPTAIMAANDLIAVGAMGVLEAAGLRVPQDISVVGYDNSLVSQLDLVALTSVEQPVPDFATAAVRILVERVEGRLERVSLEFEPSLQIRATTAPAARA